MVSVKQREHRERVREARRLAHRELRPEPRARLEGRAFAVDTPTAAARKLPDLVEAWHDPESTKVGIGFIAGAKGNRARHLAEGIVAELVASTRCRICGRDLTDPVSISRGIGPDCLQKFGGLPAWYGEIAAYAESIAARREDAPLVEETDDPVRDLPTLEEFARGNGMVEVLRDELTGETFRRPTDEPGATWEGSEAFYEAAAPRARRLSPEVDYGVHWHYREGLSWPRYRVSLVVNTGEVVAVATAPAPSEVVARGHVAVELLGIVDPTIGPKGVRERAEEVLEGWAEDRFDKPLSWVRQRLDPGGAR